MPTDSGSQTPKKSSSGRGSSSKIAWLARLTTIATSQVAAVTKLMAALAAASLCFQKLRTAFGLSTFQCAALVAALPTLVFLFDTLPTLRNQRRKRRLSLITGSTRAGFFQLSPRENEKSFRRADGKHVEVLTWLKRPHGRVLYLTGTSGTGKSSLLAAWALPKLEREGFRVIRLRGYQDPAQALEERLRKPGEIWKRNPPLDMSLSALFDQAVEKLRPSGLLVVLDQFEEFLIIQEEQKRRRFVEFLSAQAGLCEGTSGILLVFRAEYDGFIQELNLPAPAYGQNLQKVSAFNQRAAQEFLQASGLKIDEKLRADVLHEAAGVEETKGLIRPITLNLCGLVLERFSTGLPRSFRPGKLIRGFVQEAISGREVRDAAAILLRKLISPEGTKRPRTIDELAKGTALTARQAQGVMFKLGDPERGIVHNIDPDFRTWEISHDFLVPIIDSALAGQPVSLWRKARPWLPLVYAASLALAFLVARRTSSDPITELNRLGWTTRILDANSTYDQPMTMQGIKYYFALNSMPTDESVRVLQRVNGRFAVSLNNLPSFDSAHFEEWKDLNGLAALDLKYNEAFSNGKYHEISDFSGVRDLPRSLISLDLSGNPYLTETTLKDLPRSLKTLDLSGDREITDAGLKDLPRTLTTLELSSLLITDAGIRNLPRSLDSLELENDEGITDAGLKDLPQSLTALALSYSPKIADAWLSNVPRSLTSLDLRLDPHLTDAGLKDLPQSLISLNLTGDIGITGSGFKDLPRSLTSLILVGDPQITEEVLQSLPPSVKVTTGYH